MVFISHSLLKVLKVVDGVSSEDICAARCTHPMRPWAVRRAHALSWKNQEQRSLNRKGVSSKFTTRDTDSSCSYLAGVSKAISNVNDVIAPALIKEGIPVTSQKQDRKSVV